MLLCFIRSWWVTQPLPLMSLLGNVQTQPMHAEWYQRLHLEPEVVVQHVLVSEADGP